MVSKRVLIASLVMMSTAVPGFAYNHARRGPTSSSLFKHHSSKSASKPTGPRAIEPERATEIQEALIREGYLTGSPSGHWDAESQAAMQRLQASKGWQTKLTPDSRALILLGLGPQKSRSDNASGDGANLSGRHLPTSAGGATSQATYSVASLDK